MEEKVEKYGWKDEVKGRWNTFKYKTKDVSRKVGKAVCEWAEENPQAASAIVVGTVLGCVKIGKTAVKNHSVRSEQYWRDTHVYDHSAGKWVELRRKLKGSEYAKVLERKEATGKSISVVLGEMGFLK